MRKNKVSENRVKTSDILDPEKISKMNIFRKSIDWLSVSLETPLVFFNKVDSILDNDNSNSYYDSIYEYTVQKYNTKQGSTLAIYESYCGFPVMLASITRYSSGLVNASNAWGNIQFTSSFFRLAYLKHDMDISSPSSDVLILHPLLSFLASFQKDWDLIYKLGTLYTGSLARLDYALDIEFIPTSMGLIPDIKELVNPRSNSKVKKYYEGDLINAWVFGSRTSKNMYFRCYDKNLDTSQKWKGFLFPEYQDKHIARFEVEHLYHSISKYTFREISQAMSYCDSLVWLKDRSFSYRVDRKLVEKVYKKQALYHVDKFVLSAHGAKENPFIMLSESMRKNLLEEEYNSYFSSFFN